MDKNLKNLNLSFAYNSGEDDILNEFYIPSLSASVLYKRIGGYFSSSSFALAARGLSNFINNGGKMKLIVNHILSKNDVNVIREINNKEIKDSLLKEFNSWDFEDNLIKDHVKAFGWMLANDLLELKVAISNDDRLFHQKVGIMEDTENNKLSFSGSNNETAAGWMGNIEEFKVFKSWVPGQKQYMQSDEEKFDNFWLNKVKNIRVIEAPDAVKEKLIKIAPTNFSEINLDKNNYNFYQKSKKENLSLRSIQKDAVNKWKENNFRGILEMATGTGKTFTALSCLNEAIKEKNIKIAIIAAPQNHLLNQWEEELEDVAKNGNKKEFGELNQFLGRNILVVGSRNYRWKQDLSNKLLDLKNGLLDRLIIFTTHKTLSSELFKEKLSSIKLPSILIVDEVHGVGAPETKEGLLDSYDLRLALSATPERWMDEGGSKIITDFFSDKVFEFTLKDAITKKNPDTGETYLTPYNYMPYFTELTQDEAQEYKDISKKIGKLSQYKDKNDKYDTRFERLLIKRADILKSAENKLITLREIIKDINEYHGSLDKALVYCNNKEQLNSAEVVLNDMGIKEHQFTSEEGVVSKDKYSGISERSHIIKEFESGYFQALVAIKCLDEGVDIPSAIHGIILASSTNPKEYIQRRGRILRRHPSKNKSYIYDIIVIPPSLDFGDSSDSAIKAIERNIYKKEMKRYKEFAKVADNSAECLLKLIDVEKKYNIFK